MAAGSGSRAALLRHAAVLVRARRTLNTMFSKYLLVTNVTTAFTLAGTGDFINQRYEKISNIRNEHSMTRTRNQCIIGIIFGTSYHFWYIFLDRYMPGNAARMVFKKVFVDQIIMVPISVPTFLISLGLLEGQDWSAIISDVKNKGPPLLAAEWTFGPIAQLFNFFVLPTRFRVVYDSVIALCFDSYYTYVKYRSHLKAGEMIDSIRPVV